MKLGLPKDGKRANGGQIRKVIEEVTGCGISHEGEYPADVTAQVQYGAVVRVLVAKLSVDCRMPMEQISGVFEEMYGYRAAGQPPQKLIPHCA